MSGDRAPPSSGADQDQDQKLRMVGQLAGGIAHDFNNVLTAILAAADAILQRGETAETVADARQIRLDVQRGAALVHQLLAFSRQQTLQPRVVAVNAAVGAAAALLRRLLGERVSLTVSLEQPGRRVLIDPGQLDQVLVNLALNARDAMADGGSLTLSTGHATLYAPRRIGSETIPPGRYVTITVADTGSGIAPEVMPHIFEPFFTTRRASGGNGLGLSTVLGIIRQSGGFLEVDSEVGRGTRVQVHLPRHEGAAETAPPLLVEAPAPAGGAGRIALLAEDEEPVRRLLTRALTRAGWRVLAAETAEAALAMVRQPENGADSQPSVVIADVVMPGMDGLALVRALRRIWPGLPAVLVSGYAAPALRQDLASADITYLSKPYAIAELLEAVALVCGAAASAATERRARSFANCSCKGRETRT